MSRSEPDLHSRISYSLIEPGRPGRYPATTHLVAGAFPIMHIPVYFDSEAAWKRCELEAVEERFEQYAEQWSLDLEEVRLSRSYQLALNDFDPMAWEYNQVVGWLQLWAGTTIWAECWWPKKSRIRRTGRPRETVPHGEVFQCSVDGLDSAERYQLAHRALSGLKRLRPFNRRHIDMSHFHAVGPHIDWLGLESRARAGKP